MGSWPNNSTCRVSGCRQLSNASRVWYCKYFMFSDLAGRERADLDTACWSKFVWRLRRIPLHLEGSNWGDDWVIKIGVASHSWNEGVDKQQRKAWKSCAVGEGDRFTPPPFSKTQGGGGILAEKCGLSGLSAKLRGCFPSSAASPELLRLVSCGADRVSRQASWLLLLSAGGAGGCNLCQATWRFGLDWSVSAPHTQWALLDTMGTLPPQQAGIYQRTFYLKRQMFEPALCAGVESPFKSA